ncbi:hypothetical protein LJB62_15870, partial [Bacillus sp. DFI.2.34]|nr:hypothetical protein [Bacillus sp. DFI.2.34]
LITSKCKVFANFLVKSLHFIFDKKLINPSPIWFFCLFSNPYLFRFKEDRIKSITDEFEALKNMEEEEGKKANVVKIRESEQRGEITWVNDIDYRGFGVNVFECELEDEKRKQKFTFITDIKITKNNAKKLMNAGRSRWRIENEGFNRQKNALPH